MINIFIRMKKIYILANTKLTEFFFIVIITLITYILHPFFSGEKCILRIEAPAQSMKEKFIDFLDYYFFFEVINSLIYEFDLFQHRIKTRH